MQDFAAKQNVLFACLDEASKEIKGTVLDQSGAEKSSSLLKRPPARVERSDRSLYRMRGKESIFKKPELPLAKCLKPRKVPDYQINPHKWKKYSLSDVDISDHTNTAAAFEFLKQIDEQRELEQTERIGLNADEEMREETKIEFKKSSKIKRNMRAIDKNEVADAEVDKPRLKGSKLLMPEYVIGQKKEKPKKELKRKTANIEERSRAAGGLTLSHLQEDVDDEED